MWVDDQRKVTIRGMGHRLSSTKQKALYSYRNLGSLVGLHSVRSRVTEWGKRQALFGIVNAIISFIYYQMSQASFACSYLSVLSLSSRVIFKLLNSCYIIMSHHCPLLYSFRTLQFQQNLLKSIFLEKY